MPGEKIYIYGRNPVQEALNANPEKIEKIFIKDTSVPSFNKIIELSKNNRVPISKVPVDKITSLVGRVNDQGIVALMSSIEYQVLLDWIYDIDLETNPCVMVLDGIEDPHNFGAVIRTATACGIQGIVVPKQGQAPVSAVVHKTSAGTVGKIPVIRSHSTSQALNDLKAAGFEIVGLSSGSDTKIWDYDFKKPLAIVVGGEGFGLKRESKKYIDDFISFPMEHNVESLNASVTAAIVLYEWRKQLD